MRTILLRLIGLLVLGWGLLQGMALKGLVVPHATFMHDAKVFGASLVAGMVGARVVLRWHWVAFLLTMAHERAHALAIFVTGGRIVDFYATPGNGGHVHHQSRLKLIVSIAPYVLPQLGLLVLATMVILGPHRHHIVLVALLAGALGVHLTGVVADIKACAQVGWMGSDFGPYDRPGALALVAGINLIMLATLACYAIAGRPGVSSQWQAAEKTSVGLANEVRRGVVSVAWRK